MSIIWQVIKGHNIIFLREDLGVGLDFELDQTRYCKCDFRHVRIPVEIPKSRRHSFGNHSHAAQQPNLWFGNTVTLYRR